MQPVQHIQDPPCTLALAGTTNLQAARTEASSGIAVAGYSQAGFDEQIPIDEILGKQGSLVRESSAIKAYPGGVTSST